MQTQLRGIARLEIRVIRTDGKWKASQNLPAQNKAGVIDGSVRDGKGDAARVIREAMAEQGTGVVLATTPNSGSHLEAKLQ